VKIEQKFRRLNYPLDQYHGKWAIFSGNRVPLAQDRSASIDTKPCGLGNASQLAWGIFFGFGGTRVGAKVSNMAFVTKRVNQGKCEKIAASCYEAGKSYLISPLQCHFIYLYDHQTEPWSHFGKEAMGSLATKYKHLVIP